MRNKKYSKTFIALLVSLLAFPTLAWGNETARAVGLASSSVGLYHAAISFAVPNPVTPVTSFIYGCIGLGAGIYDAVTDPPPSGAPIISQIVTGPATDFNPATGEFIASGTPLTSARAGRIVSIKGSNFSFVQRENVVLFNGKAAPTSPLASNTLVSTVVPPVAGPLPALVELRIVVNGVSSSPVAFTILPPPSTGGPSPAIWMGQAKSFSQRTRDFDWIGLLNSEAPNLTQAEKENALYGARRMVRGSERSLVRLAQLEDRLALDANLSATAGAILGENPEVQALISAALGLLGTPQGPPSVTIQDLQPPTVNVTASRPGPPAEIDLTIQDTGAGLSDIGVLHADNVILSIPQFTADTTSPVVVNAKKVDNNKVARVELICIDGTCNDGTGDPIITLVLREKGKPVEVGFSNIPKAEGKVAIANGNPGVTNLLVTVNGVPYRVTGLRDNETRNVDISGSMLEGDDNYITLTASGRPGGSTTVLIHD